MGRPAAGGGLGGREFSTTINVSARIGTRAEVGREDHFSHDAVAGLGAFHLSMGVSTSADC
jgi:hypothetical protein